MRTPKLVKALLLSTALFAIASPAYASRGYTIISANQLTASFQVLPNFTLQWTDSQGENPTNSLAEKTVAQDETVSLYLKASSNQEHYYRIKYVITRTDETNIQDTDATINGQSGSVTDNHELIIYANVGHISANGTNSPQANVTFNTAGTYAITATAVEYLPV